MQRVVRSTLVGLSLIGLAACGDKVNLTVDSTVTPPVESVQSVSVTPNNITLAIDGTASLVATVTATSGITNRTVTWTSSNTTVATVTAAGVVTGKAAGTAAIVATSVADTKVTGAAAVTVTPTQPVTVTISTINQTVCGFGGCNSVPANPTNIAGQLDVTLNVEAAGAPLRSVSVILKSGTDSIVQTQSISNVAPVALDGDAATVPVTISINTAAFNATGTRPAECFGASSAAVGGPCLRNGTATIRAIAVTGAGTGTVQTASTNTNLVLNNADVSVVALTILNQSTDANAKVWFGGPVTIAATPVLYSGRTASTVTVGLAPNPIPASAAVTNSFTVGSNPLPPVQAATATAGTWSATYSIAQGAGNAPTSVFGVGASNIVPTVSVVDNQGNTITAMQPFTVGTSATNRFTPTTGTFALDAQKPAPGTFPIISNPLQQTGPNGYVSGNFRFVADSAAGFVGATPGAAPLVFVDRTIACSPAGIVCNQDNGGVNKTTVVFQWRVTGGAASTYAALTSTAALVETATSGANQFRMLTSDAVGNTDTTTFATVTANGTASNFGVDKTPPTVTVTGPAANATSQVANGNGVYVLTVSDALSGATAINLVAQTRLSNAFLSTSGTPAENLTNAAAGPCVIGRFNAAVANSGAGALPVFDASGNARGFCTPVLFNTSALPSNNTAGLAGYYATTLIGLDEAGNRATAITNTVLDDIDNPVISSVDMPPTITGNATATFPASATDAVDLVASFAVINYATPTNGAGAVALQYASTAGPGVAFDNVLTRSATISPTVANFIRNLQQAHGVGVVATAAGGNATSVGVSALDASNRVGTIGPLPFAPGVTLATGSSAAWSVATFTGGMAIFASPATVSNGPTATATNPAATTITATATGVTGTFNNPFTGGVVQIWYQVAGAGPWFLAGNAGAGSSRDNGVNRFWDYTFNWDPPATSPNGTSLTTAGLLLNIRAIGVNSAGDAVSTNGVAVITIANP